MRTVVVDGVEIPEALIAQEAQNHPEPTGADAWAAAGHALALRALLLDRARALGIDAAPEADADGREETPEEAMIRALLDEQLEIATPSEAECRRVYDAGRSRFRSPPLYAASHILIAPGGGDEHSIGAARAQAAELIAALRAGGDFAALAEAYSHCPSGKVGGALGQLRAGDLAPEVEQALLALEPGVIAPEPALSRFGWHVLRLDHRVDGRELPFEAVVEKIRLHLESRAWAAAAARFAAELTAEARARGVALTLTPEGEVAQGSASLGAASLGAFLADGAAAHRLQPWLASADPGLAHRLAKAAESAGESVPEFVQAAVAEFVDDATDERWTNLISAARDADDPALACLATLLRSKIEPAKRTFTVIRRT